MTSHQGPRQDPPKARSKAGQKSGKNGQKLGENPQNTNPKLKRMTKARLEKGTKQMALQVRPPTVIDLQTLENVQVPERILARGVELKKKNRVKQNSLYPWRFMVSGDVGEGGAQAYLVDLSTYECGCLYHLNTHSTCKHMIAALLVHMEQAQVG